MFEQDSFQSKTDHREDEHIRAFCFCYLDLDRMTLTYELDIDILKLYVQTKKK